MPAAPLKVVAALIERQGRVLICQRKAGDRYGLKWEFPGGKAKRGESPRAALARELEEELGIQALIGDEIARYAYRYPKRPAILLVFYRVTAYRGRLCGREFEEIRWETRGRLARYDFVDGDLVFVRRLARREL